VSASPTDVPARRLSLHTSSKGDGVVIIACTGELVSGVTDVLYHEVKNLIPESKRIVLDFTDLARVDSMGLGTLVRLYVSAKASGCTLQLHNLSKRVRELMGLTHLLSVFEICGENDIRVV